MLLPRAFRPGKPKKKPPWSGLRHLQELDLREDVEEETTCWVLQDADEAGLFHFFLWFSFGFSYGMGFLGFPFFASPLGPLGDFFSLSPFATFG